MMNVESYSRKTLLSQFFRDDPAVELREDGLCALQNSHLNFRIGMYSKHDLHIVRPQPGLFSALNTTSK